MQSYDPFNFYFYAFREACFAAELIVVSGYGFFDKHINDNLANAFKINPNRKLMINCYNREESFTMEQYKEDICRRLGITDNNAIHIYNKPARDFFNEDLNVDTFSSLFPDSSDEAEVLPE